MSVCVCAKLFFSHPHDPPKSATLFGVAHGGQDDRPERNRSTRARELSDRRTACHDREPTGSEAAARGGERHEESAIVSSPERGKPGTNDVPSTCGRSLVSLPHWGESRSLALARSLVHLVPVAEGTYYVCTVRVCESAFFAWGTAGRDATTGWERDGTAIRWA